MIEYSQPNTHKILHVGHMRNLCLGNSLVRLNKYLGHEVIASTYPGDVGTHVAKCLWYLKYMNKEALPNKNQGDWLGNDGRIYLWDGGEQGFCVRVVGWLHNLVTFPIFTDFSRIHHHDAIA